MKETRGHSSFQSHASHDQRMFYGSQLPIGASSQLHYLGHEAFIHGSWVVAGRGQRYPDCSKSHLHLATEGSYLTYMETCLG